MSNKPVLAAAIQHTIGTLELDVSFQLTQPWTILFGSSGSGKSSVLRIIAGLLDSPRSHVHIQGKDVSRAPAHKRGIRMAFQRPALFPHRTVLQNLRFANSHHDEQSLLDLFRIAPLAGRYPHQLSGGEAQRVNLARVCAASGTRLLLLDEPFTGLDLSLRDELLAAVRQWTAQQRIPVLSVTHDVPEALQLNAEVLRLHQGRITAQGPASAVLGEERARLLTHLAPDLAPGSLTHRAPG